MPRIALAGSGDLARYFCEEFVKAGHEVVCLTRSEKQYLNGLSGVSQKITDYSVPSLLEAIGDSEALVSTILDYSARFTQVHFQLIEACRVSARCKRFIPSEYGGNLEDYPDQPAFYYANHEPIRKVLREQNGLEWTLISVGWLIDYIIPENNRYLKDIGEAFPINLRDKDIVIPGAGNELVDVVSARDVARAVAVLLQAVSWEPYTYISGEKTTWNALSSIIQKLYPDIQIRHKSLTELVQAVRDATDHDSEILAYYQIFSVSNASNLDVTKVQSHREKYFKNIHFRQVQEFLEESKKHPDIAI